MNKEIKKINRIKTFFCFENIDTSYKPLANESEKKII